MSKVKNVIILNDFDFINGGTAQIAIGTANALAESGLNVVFFSGVTDPARNDIFEKVTTINTGQHDILNNPNRLNAMVSGIWNKRSASELDTLLKKFSPADTIVHIHGWSKSLSASIGKVLYKRPFATICTLHDYFIACPNGGFYNFKKNKICTLKPMSPACICTNCDAKGYTQKVWRVIRQKVQSDRGKMPQGIGNFITVSGFSRDILTPFLPQSAKVFTISNPINVSAKPERANVFAERVLCIGRLSTEKGVSIACEAARINKVPLTVIGDGPLNHSLRSQYPEVEFKGWLQPAEIFAKIKNARALIFPSLLYETQGLVVLEALSHGLPVIVSDKCAASEFVDGNNGLLFEIGNVQDLSKKLISLYSYPEKADTMSKYAYDKYWNNPLTTEKYIDELQNAYQEILANNPTK